MGSQQIWSLSPDAILLRGRSHVHQTTLSKYEICGKSGKSGKITHLPCVFKRLWGPLVNIYHPSRSQVRRPWHLTHSKTAVAVCWNVCFTNMWRLDVILETCIFFWNWSTTQTPYNCKIAIHITSHHLSGQIITTSMFSLTGIMVNKWNHPKMTLFQVSELL